MFETFLKKHNITEKTICVGVSGGSDSLALVLMANQELLPLGYKIIAVTVNHHLRPSAQDEADYVAKIMQTYGIEHHILHWEGHKPVSGIEEAARKARYSLIGKWCKENKIKILMTAHHLYDQAETFFMRLERGSGLDGLCGMQEVFKRDDMLIIRPLLYTNPKIMKDYLIDKNISWIDDESNYCTDLLRVKIRQFLPEFEIKTGISVMRIAETMKRLQTSKNYIENKVLDVVDTMFENYENKVFTCHAENFNKLDDEIKFKVISKILKTIACVDYAPQADKIFNLMNKIRQSDFRATTLGYCYICIFDNKLWFQPEKVENESYTQKAWKEYVKKHKQYKNKKMPIRVKKLIYK